MEEDRKKKAHKHHKHKHGHKHKKKHSWEEKAGSLNSKKSSVAVQNSDSEDEKPSHHKQTGAKDKNVECDRKTVVSGSSSREYHRQRGDSGHSHKHEEKYSHRSHKDDDRTPYPHSRKPSKNPGESEHGRTILHGKSRTQDAETRYDVTGKEIQVSGTQGQDSGLYQWGSGHGVTQQDRDGDETPDYEFPWEAHRRTLDRIFFRDEDMIRRYICSCVFLKTDHH